MLKNIFENNTFRIYLINIIVISIGLITLNYVTNGLLPHVYESHSHYTEPVIVMCFWLNILLWLLFSKNKLYAKILHIIAYSVLLVIIDIITIFSFFPIPL